MGLSAGRLVDGGIRAQVHQAVANLAHLLEDEGASLGNVVKTTVFLRHIGDFADMNDAYVEAFGQHRPARATVAVTGLPLDALVEIDAWAYVSPPEAELPRRG